MKQIEDASRTRTRIVGEICRRATTGLDRLSTEFFDAAVDLTPHQIEAALFALEAQHEIQQKM